MDLRGLVRRLGFNRAREAGTHDAADGRTPRVCVPGVQFLVPINGTWGTLAEHHATARLLLDHYVNPATNPEEVCAAAVWVHADGKPWNSPEASELFDHIAWWLRAVTALLAGETSAFIWAWEECGMHATREGELIILEERTHNVEFRLPPACFELRRFAEELRDATREGAALELGLRQLADEQYPAEWRRIVIATKRSDAGLPPLPPDGPPDPVMDDFGRRLFNASGRQSLRLGKEIEREQEKRRKADPEGFARQEQADHLRQILQMLPEGELSAAWLQLSAALDLKN